MIETNFKHTDIGLIPHDWVVKTVDEFADITTGSQNTQDNVPGGQYPFFVRSQKVERIDKYIFDTEGVVTAGDGVGTGKIFHYINGKFGLHQRCYLMHNFVGVSPKYFYWVFSQNFYDRVQGMTAKSSVDSVRRDMIADMPIILPSTVAEQERIAKALSEMDELIAAMDEQVAKKRLIRKGAMQQLLSGRTRMPGFTDKWENMTVNDICNRYDNLRIPVAAGLRKSGDVPYYGANGIQDYVEGYTHDGEYILVAEDGANSLTDYPIQYACGKIWVNNHAHVLQAKNNVAVNRFLKYAFKTIDFESNIVGSGRAKLNADSLMKLELSIPVSIEEQRAIADTLSAMDEEIQTLQEERNKYALVKQGMMQQLLTGKIRI